jgi:glycosyltransferase involved in cell wall biosynthesis
LNQRVGIVVPTLGERPDYLEQCLKSIRKAGESHILIVAPKSFDNSGLISSGLVDSVIEDPGAGLPAAINQGIDSLPKSVEYINWLGDDDLPKPGSLSKCSDALDQ